MKKITPKQARIVVESHWGPGEAKWMRKNLDGLGYMRRAYSALHGLALDNKQRQSLLRAILHFEMHFGAQYDEHARNVGAL